MSSDTMRAAAEVFRADRSYPLYMQSARDRALAGCKPDSIFFLRRRTQYNISSQKPKDLVEYDSSYGIENYGMDPVQHKSVRKTNE